MEQIDDEDKIVYYELSKDLKIIFITYKVMDILINDNVCIEKGLLIDFVILFLNHIIMDIMILNGYKIM